MPGPATVKIDTIPIFERPVSLELKIPRELLDEFKGDVRIVVKPRLVGIPVIDRFVSKDLLSKLGKDFEIFIVPKM